MGLVENTYRGWFTSIVGLLVLAFDGVLFFVEPIRDVSNWAMVGIAVVGLLLMLAPKTLERLIVGAVKKRVSD